MKNMKNKKATQIVAVVAGIFIIILLCVNNQLYQQLNDLQNAEIKVRRDTTVQHDTIWQQLPTPIKEELQGSVIAKLPSATKSDSDTATNYTPDSVMVEIPITTKTFTDSATYTAVISGYNTSLDRIEIYQRTERIVETVTRTEKKRPRWGVGIQAGVSVFPNEVRPYIGVGVTYNIFTW